MKRFGDQVLGAMVCISLFIHALLFVVLSKHKKKIESAPPFRMEWHSFNDSEVASSSRDQNSQDAPSASQKHKTSPAKTLQGVLRTDWSSVAQDLQEGEALAQEIADVDIAAHGVQAGIEKTLRDDLELPLLWKQIRVFLRYRPEHALARIAGDVQIRIRVDRYGKLLRIFEEGATGREELLGWTILCLQEAFREPFLTKPLQNSRTLDLRVQYTMGEQVLASQAKSARMLFVVEGDLYSGSDPQEESPTKRGHLQPPDHPNRIPFEIKIFSISTKQIMDTFKDKTLKNHKEWNYYVQRDYYQEQCHRHLNALACEKLKLMTNKVEP